MGKRMHRCYGAWYILHEDSVTRIFVQAFAGTVEQGRARLERLLSLQSAEQGSFRHRQV